MASTQTMLLRIVVGVCLLTACSEAADLGLGPDPEAPFESVRRPHAHLRSHHSRPGILLGLG